MTNTTSSQPIQSLFRTVAGWLPAALSGGTQLAPVCQKAPPRLSLRESLAETAARRTGPSLAWLNYDR